MSRPELHIERSRTIIEASYKNSLGEDMDGTFDIAAVVLRMSEMVGIALPNPGNHQISTARAVICMLVSVLPLDAIDVDEVIILVKSERILDSFDQFITEKK